MSNQQDQRGYWETPPILVTDNEDEELKGTRRGGGGARREIYGAPWQTGGQSGKAFNYIRQQLERHYAAIEPLHLHEVAEEIELAKRSLVLPPNPTEFDRIEHEKAAIDNLLNRRRSEHQESEEKARSFSGENPLDKGADYFHQVFETRYKGQPPQHRAHAFHDWESSYQAGLKARIQAKGLERVITESGYRNAAFQQAIHARAQEQARLAAAEQAARENSQRKAAAEQKAAEEKARQLAAQKAAEEKARQLAAQKAAEEKARQLDAQKAAEEKARQLAVQKAAEEKARQLAAEKAAEEKARQLAAQKAAEEKARQLAAQKAAEEKTRQLAEQKAVEDKVRQVAEQKAAEEKVLRLAQEAATRAAQAELNKLHTVTTAPDTAPSEKSGITLKDIAKAIADSDIEKFLTKLKRFTPLGMLLHTTDVANSELAPGITAAPVELLGIPGEVDLEYLAQKRGTVDVTQRLQTGHATQWLATDAGVPDTKVRIRAASLNTQTNRLEFTRDGDSEPALVWTPMAPPSDSSTTTSATPTVLPVDPGKPITLSGPELYIYPDARTENIDDYILTFPDHPGVDPIYVVFKSPRYLPGVASGQGKPITGTWLGEATRGEGAYIPSQVADRLRGRNFSDFNKFRAAVWQAISEIPELLEQFSPGNRVIVRSGGAPAVRAIDALKGRGVFELHHSVEIQDGGAVYDVDNIRVVTPKSHVAITDENRKGRKP